MSSRCQRRIVSRVNTLPSSWSLCRPRSLPFTAKRRRWSSFSGMRLLPKLSRNTWFSVRKYSSASCCCWLTQPAKMVNSSCQGWRTKLMGITSADHGGDSSIGRRSICRQQHSLWQSARRRKRRRPSALANRPCELAGTVLSEQTHPALSPRISVRLSILTPRAREPGPRTRRRGGPHRRHDSLPRTFGRNAEVLLPRRGIAPRRTETLPTTSPALVTLSIGLLHGAEAANGPRNLGRET